MPYKITPLGSGRFKVTSPHGTKSKNTSLKNAKAQVRFLEAKEHNPKFKSNKK